MIWMNLKSVIQNEASQKEKNKYILTHTCGISKNGTDENLFAGQEYICRADVEDGHVNTGEEGKCV